MEPGGIPTQPGPTTPGTTIVDIQKGVKEEECPRVVVIGHGPSCVGKGWGKEIDRYPVVRMKSPEWQVRERPRDYGRRTDFLLFSNETAGAHANSYVKPDREYWVQPKKGIFKAGNLLNQKEIPYRCPMKLFFHWNERFKGLWDHGVANFSLGTSAVLFACHFLKARELWLVGFDNLLHPELDVYYKANRGQWRTGHNWKAENALFGLILEEYGASYVTAPW